ncbi:hypothetical protein U2F10_17410 [Leptothoe sp. EHU-05/26/07-4]
MENDRAKTIGTIAIMENDRAKAIGIIAIMENDHTRTKAMAESSFEALRLNQVRQFIS